MVQTLINEVRRLGTDQNNNLLEMQGLRAEKAVSPPASPRGTQAARPPTPAPPVGRGIIHTRVGRPFVSVVDPPTRQKDGRSRAGGARECVATKFVGGPRHGRAAQVPVDQRCRSSDHSRAGYKPSETLLEGAIRVRTHIL